MRARDVIVIARRRAGLNQRELAERLGVRRGTVGRWERGVIEPRFAVVQEVMAACDLDLTLGFANADGGSWTSLIYEQLQMAPAERLRDLARSGFDRVAALKRLGEAGVAAIVVGETAGALHGWPLSLHREGGIDLLVRSGDSDAVGQVFAGVTPAEGVRVCEGLPGTWGYDDLARDCVAIDVEGVVVRVASLIDLMRVAHSEVGGFSRRFALAFDETLRLIERIRLGLVSEAREMTAQEAREAADAG